jgi:hypothetical protein
MGRIKAIIQYCSAPERAFRSALKSFPGDRKFSKQYADEILEAFPGNLQAVRYGGCLASAIGDIYSLGKYSLVEDRHFASFNNQPVEKNYLDIIRMMLEISPEGKTDITDIMFLEAKLLVDGTAHDEVAFMKEYWDKYAKLEDRLLLGCRSYSWLDGQDNSYIGSGSGHNFWGFSDTEVYGRISVAPTEKSK